MTTIDKCAYSIACAGEGVCHVHPIRRLRKDIPIALAVLINESPSSSRLRRVDTPDTSHEERRIDHLPHLRHSF